MRLARTSAGSARLLVAGLVTAALLALAAFAWLFFHRPAALGSVAVLPFRPLFGVPHDLPLELGFADVLGIRIGRVQRLAVTPSGSTRAFADSPLQPEAAGRRLGVDAVVTGSVHRAEGRVRVSLRLMSVASGRALWRASFDEPFVRLQHVETEIARGVVRALGGGTSEVERALSAPQTGDGEAYRQHLVGRFHLARDNSDGWRKAVEYFERAVKVDPRFATAFSGLADAYLRLAEDDMPPGEALEAARAAAEEALGLDPALAEAHAALGRVQGYGDGDLAAAAESFRRAMELAPNDGLLRREYALYLATHGRHADAQREAAAAVQLDPLSASTRLVRGLVLLAARRDDQAIAEARQLIEADPRSASARYVVGLALVGAGRHEEAEAELRRARAAAPESLAIQGALGFALGAAGRRAEAEAILTELERLSRGREVSPYYVAVVAAGLGRRDEVERRLGEARRQRSPRLRELRMSPVWR